MIFQILDLEYTWRLDFIHAWISHLPPEVCVLDAEGVAAAPRQSVVPVVSGNSGALFTTTSKRFGAILVCSMGHMAQIMYACM